MKKKILCVSLFIALSVSLCSLLCFSKTCDNIRHDMLRLHVLANSDSEADQSLKLKVRDAVLDAGKNIFDGSMDINNAEKKIKLNRERLINVAEKTVRDNGYNYDVDVFITDEYFSTRSYGKITLPAGQYKAVKVTIGESAGHNWWCVMFPPLCLPAAGETTVDAYLDDDECKLVKSNPKYDFRFKIIEIYEKIKDKIS